MRTPFRRRVIVPAAVASLVVAVAVGTAWYLLSEGRRMGSVTVSLVGCGSRPTPSVLPLAGELLIRYGFVIEGGEEGGDGGQGEAESDSAEDVRGPVGA
jgi:hypothetical protein